MPRLGDYPILPIRNGDTVISSGPNGNMKKITLTGLVEYLENGIDTLADFSVSNDGSLYTLTWENNTLSLQAPDTSNDINNITAPGYFSINHSGHNLQIGLKYTGTSNIVASASNYAGNISDIKFLTENRTTDTVHKLGISDLPFTNNEGTVTNITIADENGAASTITDNGTINIVGGNGITTRMVGSDLTVEYLGKVGGTVNKVISLDETVILTSISQDGSEVSIRPAKIPLLKAGRYDFASVTVDQYGRVTKIEDQKNKIDALTARIEELENQITALQDESSTDTSN